MTSRSFLRKRSVFIEDLLGNHQLANIMQICRICDLQSLSGIERKLLQVCNGCRLQHPQRYIPYGVGVATGISEVIGQYILYHLIDLQLNLLSHNVISPISMINESPACTGLSFYLCQLADVILRGALIRPVWV